MNSIRTAKRFLFPLLGLWILLYGSFSLLAPPLLDGPDSVRAEAAREMAVHDDWIVPTVNGERVLPESPLLLWSTAVSFRIFTVTDWAARLPLALYALGLIMLTLALGARLFLNPVAGFYAALILLTSAGIFLFSHLVYPQILSTLWITLAMYFFWRSLRHTHASLGTAIGFAVACALGVLSRGPQGVVIPALIVVLFLAITRNLPHLLRWHPVEAAIIFLLIALPWHVAAHGGVHLLTRYFLASPGHQNAPLLLVWDFLLLWIMPWCFFSVAALVRRPQHVPIYSKQMDPSHQARLLLVLWLIVEAAFAAFTPRHEYSILPALPALALLAAGWMAADELAPGRVGKAFAWVFLIGGLSGAAACAYFAVSSPSVSFGTDIGPLLNFHPGRHSLFFGHLTDLTRTSMGAFRIPLLIAAAALLAGALGNLMFRLATKARLANCFLAGMMAALLVAGHIALNTFSPAISSAVLAEAIRPEIQSGDTVIVNGRFEDASALSFYLQRSVKVMRAPNEERRRAHFTASGNFEKPSALAAQWSGAGRVFLWTATEAAPSLPGTSYLIARAGGREILSNQPNAGGASF